MWFREEKVEAFAGKGKIIHFSVVWVMRVFGNLRIFALGNHGHNRIMIII